jgi:AcrR family transcriptional regulator
MSIKELSRMHASVAGSRDLASLPPRDRILSSACELFYRDGVIAVGVEAIAAAALTNKMTLYRHFRSKDELIVAYVTQVANEGDAVWDNLQKEHPDAPEKRLDAWVDHVEDLLTNKFKRGCALANAAVELPAAHPARDVIEAYKERKRKRLVELFAAVRCREPERLADEVFLLFEGARISLQCGSRIPATRIVSMLRDLLAQAPRRRRN